MLWQILDTQLHPQALKTSFRNKLCRPPPSPALPMLESEGEATPACVLGSRPKRVTKASLPTNCFLLMAWVHSVHLMKSGVPRINVTMNETPLFKGGSKGRKQTKSCWSRQYSHSTLEPADLGQVTKTKSLL